MFAKGILRFCYLVQVVGRDVGLRDDVPLTNMQIQQELIDLQVWDFTCLLTDLIASRALAHWTLAHHLYFIDACQVNRSFSDFIFPALCSRENVLLGHTRFIVLFFIVSSFLDCLSLLSCIFT